MTHQLESFIEKIKSKGFICPDAKHWNDFYSIFNIKLELPKPLILAAWWHTSDIEKFERFLHQLKILEQNKLLDDALEFLNNLSNPDWYKNN